MQTTEPLPAPRPNFARPDLLVKAWTSHLWKIWSVILLISILIYSFYVTYRLTFKILPVESWYWILALVYLLDFLFRWVLTSKADRRERSSFLFFVDLMAAIPLDGGMDLLGITSTPEDLWYWHLFFFEVISVIKILRVPALLRQIEDDFSLNPGLIRLVSFSFWFSLLAHLTALGWVLIGAAELQRPIFDQYLRSLYWAITTLATIGFGDYYPNHEVNSQIVYCMVIEVFGVVMTSYIIGNVAGIIANLDVAKAHFTKVTEEMKAFLRAKGIPAPLQARVSEFFSYFWNRHKSLTPTKTMLSELPESLSTDILLHINRPILEKVDFFQKADPFFLREVVHLLEPQVYLPGDFVIRQGEEGNAMYFLTKGSAEVLVGSDTVGRLHEGSPFGETALILTEVRNASIVASEFCDVFRLSRDDFERLRHRYPDFDRSMKALAEKRLRARQ